LWTVTHLNASWCCAYTLCYSRGRYAR